MLYDVFTLLLPFLGIAVTLALIACCVLLLIKRTQVAVSLLYILVAGAFGFVLSKGLFWQSTGIVCALPQTNTILLYLIVIVLFVFFICDRFKLLRSSWDKSDDGQGA